MFHLLYLYEKKPLLILTLSMLGSLQFSDFNRTHVKICAKL